MSSPDQESYPLSPLAQAGPGAVDHAVEAPADMSSPDRESYPLSPLAGGAVDHGVEALADMSSSPDQELHPLPPLAGGAVLDPAVEALVERLLQSRLADSEHQMAAQLDAWRRQEGEMLDREAVMRETIEGLHATIASRNEALIHPNRGSTSDSQGSSTGSGSSHTTLHAGSNSDRAALQRNPRKRYRKNTEVVPDTAPARNTCSSRQSSLSSQSALSLPKPTIPPTIPIDSNLIGNVPTSPPPISSNGAVDQLPPTDLAPPVNLPPAAGTTEASKSKMTVKAVGEVYRVLPQDMPEDMGGLQKAMFLHLRILWALLDAKDVPKNPSSQLLTNFNKRFSTELQLNTSHASDLELIPRQLVQIGTAMSSAKGRIANQARLVEENMLTYIQMRLARLGLNCWCPDLRQSPYSLYNSACRIIALETFKQALISQTYIHLGPNTAYATQMDILIKIYDHFVFHFMFLRYQKENWSPGSVLQELQALPQYQARIRLATSRSKFLKDNSYPDRYLQLINSKATSDDERDPSGDQYFIKRRPERSQKAEEFIRMLDHKHQQDSVFTALPEGMPIDYFDPVFFNNLQPRTRNRIAVRKVALLPDMGQSFTWNTEERLSDGMFTRKYGTAVFSAYNMVGNAEMARMPADDEWEVFDDQDINDDDDMALATQNMDIGAS